MTKLNTNAIDLKSSLRWIFLALSLISGASNAQTSVDLSEYELVFGDEFDSPTPGSVVDPAKWSTRYYWGPYVSINGEEQLYVDTLGLNSNSAYTPFSIDNGVLTIEAVPTTSSLLAPSQPDANDSLWVNSADLSYQDSYSPNNVDYLSGLLTSASTYNATHGYFEARLKFPKGQGLWPAFWLLNAKYVENSPEIDIVEFLGHETDTVYHTMHYIDRANNYHTVSTPSYETQGTNFTEDFHTYGLAWDPTKIRFYVDGKLVREITDSEFLISNQSMYLILNLAVGGNWPGPPDASTEFPAKFEVDYVRAYERKSIPTITPQVLTDEYQLMFSDEFNGNSLNPNVWNSAFLWGPYLQINNEEQVYIDKLGIHQNHPVNPFEVSSGTLKIKAEPIASDDLPTLPEASDSIWNDFQSYQRQTNYLEDGGWMPEYSSGILTSYDSFKFVNGYAEARIKMPTGSGIWPAFWLLNGYYVGPSPEMDIVEVRGSEPFKTHHSYHFQNSIGVLQSSAEIYDLPGAGVDEFHTYGFQWDRERMVWYVDGVPVRETLSSDVSIQLSYVLLNLAVGGNFVENVGPDVTPSELEVDYVRVYQLNSIPDIVQPPAPPTPPPADIELAQGQVEEGEYGWLWGTRSNIESVSVGFAGTVTDLNLNVVGYDIDFNSEVAVYLNDVRIGFLKRGSNNKLNAGDTFLIPASDQQPNNLIEFRQNTPGYVWGVTDISITAFSGSNTPTADAELVQGQIENGEYGWLWGTRSNIESVSVTFAGTGADLNLDVVGYDIDFSNEVAVYLNDARIGFLKRGSNNQLNAGDTFLISASDQQSNNLIEFRQSTPGYVWGVTDISITTSSGLNTPTTDVELVQGQIDNGEYGWLWGTRSNIESVSVAFTGTATDLNLDVVGYDIDFSKEVAVYLNDARIGFLKRGSNNQLNAGDTFLIPASDQQPNNLIEFRQNTPGYVWGVTNFLLENTATN